MVFDVVTCLRRLSGRSAAVWLVLGAALLAAPAAARADVAGLAREVDALRSELAALRHIQPVQATPAERAQFEVRLGQLEEELRRLTGRIEQLEFNQRSVESRLDQLVQDLDVRLSALEQGTAAPQGEAAPQSAPGPSADAGTGAERGPGEEAAAASAADQGSEGQGSAEGTLGVVPESALLDLPRADAAAATPPKSSGLPAQRQYDSAMELLRAGDYPSAERGLALFLDLNPDHPLASNAAYWMAETFYVRKNYAAAASGFARNYRTYGKDAPKAPDNLLKLGMSLYGLGEAEKACLSYAELEKEFPNAPTHIQQALSRERERAGCS
jgi:tol-pal system protein YbgF